jgi:hypothetical protein
MALGMTAAAATGRSDRGGRHLLLLLGVIVVAFGLRFWRLGEWGFDSDEIFMLRDSLDPRLSNPRPLMYFMNHYLIGMAMPLNEFSLRILPAVFGVLAVPTLYFITARLVNARAALFAAFLVAISPLHVYYSQFARYWSLVFLLCAVYPYALYMGIRERNSSWLFLGVVTGVLAVLAHPASVLLLAGLGAWILVTYVTREQMVRVWTRTGRYWIACLAVVLVVATAVWFLPLLRRWVSQHDNNPASTEFLLSIPGQPGLKQILYILGFVESMTVPLVLTAALGIYLLWHTLERPLALLLGSMLMLPMIFLALLSFRTPVSTFYLVPTLPTLFIGAGVFLDGLSGLTPKLHPRWLLPATLTIIIFAAGAPTLASQYRDGRRYDFRGAARWLDSRLAANDVIFSDQFKVVSFYLPDAEVKALRGNPDPLMQTFEVMHQGDQITGTLWIVMPARSHAFRTNPKLVSLNDWIYGNCQLRNTIGETRIDFRQNLLQIYSCPPGRLSNYRARIQQPTSREVQPRTRRSTGAIEIPFRASTSR